MDYLNVINERIGKRGISCTKLASRIGMDKELLRRSLNGTRNLQVSELLSLCRELDLTLEDFYAVPA